MKKSTLILGGARSGKSVLAEKHVLAPTGRAIYIATAEAHDDEMAARIQAHQDRRGEAWTDHPAPLDLVAALEATDGGDPRLVDCLTLWLSNLMFAERDWTDEVTALCQTLANQNSPVVFVSNEVGMSIVPENALARQFRDAQGTLNRQIADAVDEMWFCIAGQALRMKPNDQT